MASTAAVAPPARGRIIACLYAGLLVGAIPASGGILTTAAAAATDPAPSAPSLGAFRTFLDRLRPDALARGISTAVFDAAFAGMTPDPAVAALTRRQPEEVKSTGAYLAAQVTSARIEPGRAMAARWASDLAAIEQKTGVPRSIVVAIWGLESGYGNATGHKDVLRSLATLAAVGYRPDLTRAELLAALSLLQSGAVRRHELEGSWAGAMGQPQFMPSSFATYAVDQDGDGRRDIWTSVPDVLASIANFIHQQGWREGQPWGFEVRLPPGLDVAASRGTFRDWAARGVTRPDGAALPPHGDGILYFPAGASGPAFLVTENFEVLKTYNFSDAYALSVGLVAGGIEGRAPVRARWPVDRPIGREARIALQARLAALGFQVDNREGRISLALRDTIRPPRPASA